MDVSQLIFDIGMNNGDDTAYYLFRGYDVVAVEANPTLCTAVRKRFPAEVENGRLKVENVGIAEENGELEFWVSDRSEWSSFSQANATKQNTHATAIAVRTVRFSSLLERYGAPYFLKVDIEGNDRLCLQGLSEFARPSFVAVEMSHEDGNIDIDKLSDLGYRAFKCIRQNDFFEMRSENIERQRSIRKVLGRVRGASAGGPLRRLGRRRFSVDGWSFPMGSSGPLGQELAGPWISHEEMLSVWRQLRDIDLELKAHGVGEWFDIHATLEPLARTA